MKHLTLPALALLAACATPDPLCDREAQDWNKFGTEDDVCEAPPAREREYLRVRDVTFSDPEPKPPVKPEPPKNPDCKGC